jgi:[ribosomal protein S18]-alanine N-acetyltransferase
MMRPRALASLHARCFVTPRSWTEAEFEAQLADPKNYLVGHGPGFALSRVVLYEAELLTLAVDPPNQGIGHGKALLQQIETISAARGAKHMFLEVSAENGAGRALYEKAGYVQVGMRPRYYRTPEGHRVDALILSRSLGA